MASALSELSGFTYVVAFALSSVRYFSEYFMYLSRGNATAKASLPLARNDVIWSARLRSPGYTRLNPAERAEIKLYYVTMRETLAHKSINYQLTRMATVD